MRFIKPAGRKLGMGWVNWRALRASHAAWLKLAGADPKDSQRTEATLAHFHDQGHFALNFVPASQVRVGEKLNTLRMQ